jgi:hypothetical protein
MTANAQKALSVTADEPSAEDREIADLGGSVYDVALDYPRLSFEEIADKQTPGWRQRPVKVQDTLRWHYDAAHGKIT